MLQREEAEPGGLCGYSAERCYLDSKKIKMFTGGSGKPAALRKIRGSGILMLSVSVKYLAIEMHLNIAINTRASMLSDLKVCCLTKNEFNYVFLIFWRPQQFLVLF